MLGKFLTKGKRLVGEWAQLNARFLVDNVLPSFKVSQDTAAQEIYPHLLRNRELRNKHVGSRAFVLCTGPSIASMDLRPLRSELCFSVSNFYKHQHYTLIRPKYHFVPNVFPPRTDETTVSWFNEMHASTAGATHILGDRQEKLVEKNGLFPGSPRYFLRMSLPGDQFASLESIDLTGPVPGVQSVPVMCIMAAMYMGIGSVYLLGVDHDALFTNRYDYFFPREACVAKDSGVNDDGTLTDSRYDVMLQTANLWRQYIDLKKIADRAGMKIVNVTPGSYLDVFPRQTLAEVLATPQ